MNKILLGACMIAVTSLSACSNKQPEQDSSIMPAGNTSNSQAAIVTDTTVPATTTMPISNATLNANPAATAQPVQQVTTPSVTTSKPVASGAGLNPAHGQPGHRCDISVGAPLNSPAPKATPAATTTTVTPTPTATVAPVKPATNASGAKLNPPHGQPGHDCKIAVGQPLP